MVAEAKIPESTTKNPQRNPWKFSARAPYLPLQAAGASRAVVVQACLARLARRLGLALLAWLGWLGWLGLAWLAWLGWLGLAGLAWLGLLGLAGLAWLAWLGLACLVLAHGPWAPIRVIIPT